MTESKLLANRIITPDGTLIQSHHRHDYKTYIDTNGKVYMVDGGLEYQRTNVHDDAPHQDASVYSTDTHEVIREALHWGTYGKVGNQPLQWKVLSSLSNPHVNAIVETQHQIPEHIRKVFEDEAEYRALHGIIVRDAE
jgi:hypothetical protein